MWLILSHIETHSSILDFISLRCISDNSYLFSCITFITTTEMRPPLETKTVLNKYAFIHTTTIHIYLIFVTFSWAKLCILEKQFLNQSISDELTGRIYPKSHDL